FLFNRGTLFSPFSFNLAKYAAVTVIQARRWFILPYCVIFTSSSPSLIMGRKAGGLFINSKRFSSLHKPCMKEMIMFMNCMATSHSDVEACAKQKEILNTCIESQSKKNRKSWGSINYQLQRLSRGRK
ncbi:hypothetical protein KIW84_072225, partial [Lathyrus oleraceus]